MSTTHSRNFNRTICVSLIRCNGRRSGGPHERYVLDLSFRRYRFTLAVSWHGADIAPSPSARFSPPPFGYFHIGNSAREIVARICRPRRDYSRVSLGRARAHICVLHRHTSEIISPLLLMSCFAPVPLSRFSHLYSPSFSTTTSSFPATLFLSLAHLTSLFTSSLPPPHTSSRLTPHSET